VHKRKLGREQMRLVTEGLFRTVEDWQKAVSRCLGERASDCTEDDCVIGRPCRVVQQDAISLEHDGDCESVVCSARAGSWLS
jgi:hypothetical protein